jgi:sRNA-binding carbon storage regulator CsrA
VKLGISAPDKVGVYRDEVFKRMQSESAKSSVILKEDVEELARIIKAGKSKKGKNQ